MLGPVLVLSALDVTKDWERTIVHDRELAAYIRTELRGDVSRITVPTARASVGPSIGARIRAWVIGFRGTAVPDLRGGRG